MLPILQCAATGNDMTLAMLRTEAAKRLKLSDEDLSELIPSGKQPRYINRSNWACIYLAEGGLLEWVRRGTYRITARGREALAKARDRIDIAYLMQFPEFRAWKTGSTRGGDNNVSGGNAGPIGGGGAEEVTPEEQIEAGYQALRSAVEGELISKILAAKPVFFENLVVELLLKMGYGGSRIDAGKALGRSGDGGIDGIINEDRLGLDAIYVQAKRWDPAKHKVSRPDVQAFAGSLEGFRARKGVFITTSLFSSEAHDYVARIEKRIVLIDGPRLAALLFDHGVGVRAKETYEIKEVDEEYFLED
jgi:restriction system protein